jgi:Tol biopolymer transport system component
MWEARRNKPLARRLELFLDTCCGFWTREGRGFLFRELRDARTEYWIAEEDWSLFRSGKPSSLSGGGLEMIAATASPLENVLFVVLNQNSRMTFTFDLARRQLTPFLPELSVGNPAFSRDGKWMALCQVHTRQSILWRARSDGSEWLPLTDQRLWVHHASFSADGKRIAFMAKEPNSPWKIYWVPAEGGALHKLDVPITNQADPNWAPDNQSIIFGQPPRYYAEPDAPRAIYIHNLQSGSVSKLPGSEGWFSPRVSPDGHRLLALSIDEHRLALYDFTNSEWRILVENPEKRLGIPSWSPDQEWACVNTFYGKNLSLLRVRVRDGKSEEVLSFPKLIRRPYCWAWGSAPEGSLLINCAQPNANIYALRYE